MKIIINHDDVLKVFFETQLEIIDSESGEVAYKIPLNMSKEARRFKRKYLMERAEKEMLEESNAKLSCDNKILTKQLEKDVCAKCEFAGTDNCRCGFKLRGYAPRGTHDDRW